MTIRLTFPKAKGTQLVRERSAVCECCGARPGAEFSHRRSASKGGTWAPSNGIRADHRCHRWLEDHPIWAGEGGWQIRRTLRSPLEIPAFIVTPEAPLGEWVLLDDAGGREQVHADDHGLPEVPAHLPPGHVRLGVCRPLETVPWVEP